MANALRSEASVARMRSGCATGLAMGKKIATDPALFSVLDGKVYFFSSKGAKDTFDKMPKDFITKADAQAKKLLVD